jgi:YVTN family beta-propeller protein
LPDDSRAYVVNSGDGTLSAIDLKALRLIKTVKISQSADKLWFPFRTALWLSADAKTVYVNNVAESQIEIFDAITLAHTKYEIPDIQITKLAKTTLYGNDIFNLIPQRGIAQIRLDNLKTQNIWELCPNAVDDLSFAVELNDKGQHMVAVSKFAEPDDLRFASVPRWTWQKDQPGLRIFKTMVQVAKLETGVTIGSYPVDGRTVKLQFSKDTKALFALSDLGTLSRFDLSKRLDLDQDLLCK